MLDNNNYYTYITNPDMEERMKIREQYFDFQLIRIQNTGLISPISFSFDDAIDTIERKFYIQRLFEYSCSINDELFALDYLFMVLVHTYNKYINDKDNKIMYRPILKLYAETYVSKFVSIYEKVILTIINVVDFNKLYETDNWKYSSGESKHKMVMNSFKQHYENFITLESLCVSIEEIRKLLHDCEFEEIRNNATHNISNFDIIFRFERNSEFTKIQGSHALSSFSDVIENRNVFNSLKKLMKSYQLFLEELMQKHKAVNP